MKAFKTIHAFVLAILLVTGTLVTSCGTEDGTYTAPITLSEKIHGSWVLTSLIQVDETASTKLDLSGHFEFMSFGLELNVDEAENPTTFTVTGNAPALLPLSGFWEMEHNFTNSDGSPARIILYKDAAKTTKTAVLTASAVPGASRTLAFKITRHQNGKAFLSYVYTLEPATPAAEQ